MNNEEKKKVIFEQLLDLRTNALLFMDFFHKQNNNNPFNNVDNLRELIEKMELNCYILKNFLEDFEQMELEGDLNANKQYL